MKLQEPVVIVGGGIAGMTALYENLKHGIPTVLYEKSAHAVGGVIWSKDAGNKLLDMGGELIDSGHKPLRALCKEVGLTPIDTWAEDPAAIPDDSPYTGDEQYYYFNNKTGKVHSDADFLTPHKNPQKATGLYVDLARDIRRDYDEMGKPDPATGDWLQTPFNKRLDAMPATEYLDEKCRKLAAEGKPVDPAMIQAITNAYQCENGRDLNDISALILVNQLGQGAGKGLKLTEAFSIFGDSDERYKIPGGTAALIERLREKSLEIAKQKGFPAPIQLGQSLDSVGRAIDGKTMLNFHDRHGETRSVRTGYVISALQAPALGAIAGAENLGLSAEQVSVLRNLQYTNSSKVFFEVQGTPWRDFTVKSADGEERRVTDSDGTFFGDTIKECWITGDGEPTAHGTTWMTCLVGGEINSKYSKPQDLVEACKQEYARILGKRPDDIFVSDGDGKALGTAILSNKGAGGGIGCYASPGLKQGIDIVRVSQELAKGASIDGQPVAGFVGSWVTGIGHSSSTPGIKVGYMNDGVDAAIKAATVCLHHMKAMAQAQTPHKVTPRVACSVG